MRSLVLATNQGLLYVLSMVVIGGMVGAGALGYDVVLGFSRSEEWGKGAAAGVTIVLLGVMIDRICRAAAEATGHGPDAGFQLNALKALPRRSRRVSCAGSTRTLQHHQEARHTRRTDEKQVDAHGTPGVGFCVRTAGAHRLRRR